MSASSLQRELLAPAHPSWLPFVEPALNRVDLVDLDREAQEIGQIPARHLQLAAFSMPMHRVRYVLFGEGPYPRVESANGHAFIDAAVTDLWSETGLTKPVNRATSLRNFIKMGLIAEGLLSPSETSQPAIAALDKSGLVATMGDLQRRLQEEGFLLLNTALTFSAKGRAVQDARHWAGFRGAVLEGIGQVVPSAKLVLFGGIAKAIDKMPQAQRFDRFTCEHPYNVSFITSGEVLDFFRPLRLLRMAGQAAHHSTGGAPDSPQRTR